MICDRDITSGWEKFKFTQVGSDIYGIKSMRTDKYCKDNKISLITLSGFNTDNPLTQLGNVNIHIPSKKYNFVEMAHHIILVSIVYIFAENLI